VYLIREALEQHAHDVELLVVSDGEEALDFVEGRGKYADAPKPDLIVLDLNLPKSDGSDVLRRIRQRADFSAIPVVVLTSSDSPRDRSVIASLGAESFLTKPSDLDEFLSLGEVLMRYVSAERRVSAG
jgi:CheY-like chemotaxis protein